MNRNLLQLLEERTPGIVTTRKGIERQNIPYPDSIQILKMRSFENFAEKGKWTRVRKGKYYGDVGLVVAVGSWGAKVLLVPRLYSHSTLASSLKRKRRITDSPEPALFNPEEFNNEYPPRRLENGNYIYMGHTYEHGLIRKRFDLHSIKSGPTDMPSQLFFLFKQSNHPLILTSTIPRPQEWDFEEHDIVVICSSRKGGIITTIQTTHAEVELADGEGTVSIPLHDLRKVFVAGDSVSIGGGALKGRTGLVVSINNDIAHIVDNTPEGDIPYIHSGDSIQVFII